MDGRVVTTGDAGGSRPGGDGPGEDAGLLEDLEAVVAGALAAVDPRRLVRAALEGAENAGVSGRVVAADGPPVVVAVGKAAMGMARGAVDFLGSGGVRGVVLAPASGGEPRDRDVDLPPDLEIHRGAHPVPDEAGVRGARAVLEAVETADPDRGVLFLLSGGGSALLTLPVEGVSLEAVGEVTRRLMEAGADIGELNTVRKHLDRLKGGGLARAAAPAPVRALVVSDVVGDPLDVIASGPVSPDPTTFRDALEVLERYGRGKEADASALEEVTTHLEAGARGDRPESLFPGDPAFRAVEVTVVGNAGTAVRGAAAAARIRGYRVRTGPVTVTGEAREVGRKLGRRALSLGELANREGRPLCYLSAGETTVTVRGEGKGGRNQEVALAAGLAMEEGRTGAPPLLVASLGTDGVDGPTDAAGAWVDAGTTARAREEGRSPERALERNDSYSFFHRGEGHLHTGPTGTNVMDLHIVLARPAPT